MWQMLRVYGIGVKVLKAVQCFYVDDRRARVRVEVDVSGFRLMLDCGRLCDVSVIV